MAYGHLGRSGLLVSRIGLGTMAFGFTVDESTSFAVMDAAVDAGSTTSTPPTSTAAPSRRTWPRGMAFRRRVIGRWLQRNGHRDDIVLATKVYQPMGSARTTGGCPRTTSGGPARRACGGCRRTTSTCTRCTTSTGHAVGGDLAGDGATGPRGQDQLRRQQQLRRLGRGARPVRRLGTALSRPGLRAEPLQPRRSGRRAGTDPRASLPRHRVDPVQPAPRWPARGGARAARQGRVADETQHRIDAHRDQLEAYERLCRDLGAKPADVALAWLLQNPVVSTAIVGATTIEELRADLDALSVHMDAEVIERLDQIWPGPGEAPQAYAW